MELSGKTAVITGASRGLGAGLAVEFHARGMNLALCARSESVLAGEDNVLTERFDVTDEAAMDAFASRAERRFEHIDLWINNAGILAPIKPLRDVTGAEFSRHIEINVLGVFLGTRAFVRHLHATNRPGVLINISSGAARNGYSGWSAYCAAKAAVDLMTEAVQDEERDVGLRAYAVAPGVIDTEMQALIRSTSVENFPMVDKFLQMKVEDSFSTTAHVARELLSLAFDPNRDDEPVRMGLASGK